MNRLLEVLSEVFNKTVDDWCNEMEFTEELGDAIVSSSIRSKVVQGSKLTQERLSQPRRVTRVEVDKKHPHNPNVGRPDLAIYYKGEPLPCLYGRELSNPFFIECKMGLIKKSIVQGLKYKWRGGELAVEKYNGDSVALTNPDFLNHFERSGSKFRDERYLWHTGLWLFRRGAVHNNGGRNILPILTFNEEEQIVFDIPLDNDTLHSVQSQRG